MNDKKYFSFGLTKPFDCNYLKNREEQLLVVINSEDINDENYQRLLFSGFRRSGEQVYRPHCKTCNACESIRLPVLHFAPSKSQKRIRNMNKEFTVKVSSTEKPNYYELYERYINTVHTDGGMFPADKEQYLSFILSDTITQLFIEVYDQDKLIVVAVCDSLPNALSALYTFYDPDYTRYSLGKFSILNQIDICKALNKHYLYLGYQIDDCDKMNYKKQYFPHQRLQKERWIDVNKG